MVQITERVNNVALCFRYRMLLAIGVFLLILGARLTLINSYGSDVPFWDQWDAEALNLYIPYFDGELSWQHWTQPHNEHRILLTRLVMFGLLYVNGQWDAQVQMVMNAVFYSGSGMLLFLMLMPEHASRYIWGGAVVIIFSLPFGWENTLNGFQLQLYLLIGMSMATLRFLPHARFGTWQWYLGGLCALLSLFSMASGFLVCAVVLGMLLIEMVRDRALSRWYVHMPTVVLCLFLVVSGLLLKGHVPGHSVFQAHSTGRFLLAFLTNLAWPVEGLFFWAFLQWLPFVLCLYKYFKTGERSDKMTFVIGLGLLVVLQAAATAYARGGGWVEPYSRYQDIFSLGVLVNLYALFVVSAGYEGRVKQLIVLAFAIVWTAGNCIGLFERTSYDLAKTLPQKHAAQQAALTKLSGYIKAGRIDDLLAGSSNADLPYPDARRLAHILSHPEIQKRLPPSLVPENRSGRLRTVSRGFLKARHVLIFIGLLCFLLGAICSVKIDRRPVDMI